MLSHLASPLFPIPSMVVAMVLVVVADCVWEQIKKKNGSILLEFWYRKHNADTALQLRLFTEIIKGKRGTRLTD